MRNLDGTVIEANWVDNKLHGSGKIRLLDGSAVEARWSQGVFILDRQAVNAQDNPEEDRGNLNLCLALLSAGCGLAAFLVSSKQQRAYLAAGAGLFYASQLVESLASPTLGYLSNIMS